MGKAIEKLLDISGPAFIEGQSARVAVEHPQLQSLLRRKNGFFAFEAALRVFPTEACGQSHSLSEWNSAGLWRSNYDELAAGLLFFAEDIFGTQFCLKGGSVYTFDPETADLELVGGDLEEWAEAIIADYDLLTGYSFAHEWQSQSGTLAYRDRLMPKLPFVCGGEFDLSNLVAMDAARSMRSRGNLAVQIHSLPDGAQVTFTIVD